MVIKILKNYAFFVNFPKTRNLGYLRFLEKQIIMLKREIDLNDTRDRQQKAEILYTFSKYNTHGAVYKDDRSEKSPSYFHNIDYHKLFEEQK